MNLLQEKEDMENKMTQKTKITLATGNKHKVDEINLIAKNYNLEFILPEGNFNPIEDGTDFMQNAYCKAKCATEKGKTELYLADDSGLCVDSLNGAPGIYSARYAPTVNERINKLLNELKNTNERNSKFVCSMVLVNKNGEIIFKTQNECKGSILYEEKGKNGFGYDPIFFVKSENKSMAELTDDEKAKVSHRAKSLNKVLKWISEQNK